MNNSVKVTIQLTEEQMADYPVSTESLWFDKEGDFFRLKNIPFFIDHLSFNDLVELKLIHDDIHEILRIISRSDNSTIWICINGEMDNSILKNIKDLGCDVEGGVLHGYYAVNIPAQVNFDKVYSFIDQGQESGILIADYPSIRHGELH